MTENSIINDILCKGYRKKFSAHSKMSMRLSWLARISITAKERRYNGLCKKYNDGRSNARSWLGRGLGKVVRVITPTHRCRGDASGVGALWMDQGHRRVVP